MIEGLRPYTEYRDSGLLWADRLPTHWQIVRMKHVLRERSEKGHPNEPLLAATQSKGVVRKEDYGNRTVLAQKDLHLLKLVRQRDFVISLRSFQGGIEYARHQGIISPAYTVLHPVEPSMHGYLAWLFKSKPFIENLNLHVTGIRQGQNIDYERLRRSYLPVPPWDEQAAIVRFLAHVDRKVRRYVAAKRKLIALLIEQKRAIIHQAVTRGLDPNVRLKPSGIDWLGDIPEHWNTKPIGLLCTYISYGFTNPMPTTDVGPYMLTANDIADGFVRFESARRTSQVAFDTSLTRKSRPEENDLLVTKDGTLGRIAIADGRPMCINQSVAMLRPRQAEITSPFFSILLRSPACQEKMVFDAGGTTIKHIYITRLAKMRVAFPGVAEQREIAQSLKSEQARLDQAMAKTSLQIDRIQELRSQIIGDAVTGRMDVRAAAERLPDELDDTTPDVAIENPIWEDLSVDATEEVEA